MAKRRKELKKRRKLQEESLPAEPLIEEAPSDGADPEARAPSEDPWDHDPYAKSPVVEDSQIVASPPPRGTGGGASPPRPARKKDLPHKGEAGWLGRNKENLLLGMLILYVMLLGLGTVGELFEIEWILNLPLFK